jgi:hypothetical protein
MGYKIDKHSSHCSNKHFQSEIKNFQLTFSMHPLKRHVSAAARALFNLNPHCMASPLPEKKGARLVRRHYPICVSTVQNMMHPDKM